MSPPHIVLALGILWMQFGMLLLMSSALNKAGADLAPRIRVLFLVTAGMVVAGSLVVFLEETARDSMHNARFYRTIGALIPFQLMALGIASGHRWGGTIATAGHTVVRLLMLWIFPLFAAQPKLGPVYTPVTQFIPAEFPLLLIVPAIAVDWFRSRSWRPLWTALAAGPTFTALFLAVQWPFADFLNSPAARNPVFGGNLMGYGVQPNEPYALHTYWLAEHSTRQFAVVMAMAVAMAALSSWVGLRLGRWMMGVTR